jgi:hypothetical protein
MIRGIKNNGCKVISLVFKHLILTLKQKFKMGNDRMINIFSGRSGLSIAAPCLFLQVAIPSRDS